MMNRQPYLAGELIELRPATPEDFDALFAVASDPLIWEVHPAHDRWQEPVFRAFFDAGIASGGMLIAIDRASGAVIGSSRYDFDRALAGEVEIGWSFLARSYWGGRYNGEMKALMLAHAFGSVDRVIFVIGKDNIRSRRAIERVGGKLTDRRFSAVMAGREAEHVIYAIDTETDDSGGKTDVSVR